MFFLNSIDAILAFKAHESIEFLLQVSNFSDIFEYCCFKYDNFDFNSRFFSVHSVFPHDIFLDSLLFFT